MSRSYKRNDPYAAKPESKDIIKRKGKSKGSERGKQGHVQPIEVNDMLVYPVYA